MIISRAFIGLCTGFAFFVAVFGDSRLFLMITAVLFTTGAIWDYMAACVADRLRRQERKAREIKALASSIKFPPRS